MPKDLHPDFLENIRRTASTFAEKATELSESLKLVEEALQDLPGQVDAHASDMEGRLSFNRAEGSWRLIYGKPGHEQLVVKAPVLIKARAAALLPALLSTLDKQQSESLAAVKSGLDGLAAVMPAITQLKGGAE